MSRYPKPSRARACIENAAAHIRGIFRGGKRLEQFNPNYEVRHQNEPTEGHPISMHKQFKGHTAHS